MKKKLKVKKQVWFFLAALIFLGLISYAGVNIYNVNKYHKTNEYKLLQIGYTKDEIKTLEENLNKTQINELLTTEKNTFLFELWQEKYYLKDNFERYNAYHASNLNLTANQVVTTINTLNDYEYYNHDIATDIDKDTLMLVNKFYHLSEDYEPTDLVDVSNRYYYGSNHKVRKGLYDAFKNMWEEAYKENIYLIINSSYRTFDEQKKVYEDYENKNGSAYADKVAARPGYSEHQTGLAIDIFSKENTTTSNFKGSTAHLWLQNNAHRFGFIERYPENKENITGFEAEAWHWRYVGVEVATYIHDNNITFDEYYAYFLEK